MRQPVLLPRVPTICRCIGTTTRGCRRARAQCAQSQPQTADGTGVATKSMSERSLASLDSLLGDELPQPAPASSPAVVPDSQPALGVSSKTLDKVMQSVGIFRLDAPNVEGRKVRPVLSFVFYYWHIVLFGTAMWLDTSEGPGAGADFLDLLTNDHLAVTQGHELLRLLTGVFVHPSPWALFITLMAVGALGWELEAAMGYLAFGFTSLLIGLITASAELAADVYPVTHGALPMIASLVGGLLVMYTKDAVLQQQVAAARAANPALLGPPDTLSPPPPSLPPSMQPASSTSSSSSSSAAAAAAAAAASASAAAGAAPEPATVSQCESLTGQHTMQQLHHGGAEWPGGQGSNSLHHQNQQQQQQQQQQQGQELQPQQPQRSMSPSCVVTQEEEAEAEVEFLEGLLKVSLPTSAPLKAAATISTGAVAAVQALNDLQADGTMSSSGPGIAAGLIAGVVFASALLPSYTVQRLSLAGAVARVLPTLPKSLLGLPNSAYEVLADLQQQPAAALGQDVLLVQDESPVVGRLAFAAAALGGTAAAIAHLCDFW